MRAMDEQRAGEAGQRSDNAPMLDSADFIVAIPARYAASRLPGKPLRLLGGTPLVIHVAQRAIAAGAREVWVATDDERIRDALQGTPVQVADQLQLWFENEAADGFNVLPAPALGAGAGSPPGPGTAMPSTAMTRNSREPISVSALTCWLPGAPR